MWAAIRSEFESTCSWAIRRASHSGAPSVSAIMPSRWSVSDGSSRHAASDSLRRRVKTQGIVFATNCQSAIKGFRYQPLHQRERDVKPGNIMFRDEAIDDSDSAEL